MPAWCSPWNRTAAAASPTTPPESPGPAELPDALPRTSAPAVPAATRPAAPAPPATINCRRESLPAMLSFPSPAPPTTGRTAPAAPSTAGARPLLARDHRADLAHRFAQRVDRIRQHLQLGGGQLVVQPPAVALA